MACINPLNNSEVVGSVVFEIALLSKSPTGSFTINPRLQRHFATFSVVFPGHDALFRIYESILTEHLESPSNKFPYLVKKMSPAIVNATVQLHDRCAKVTFLK